MSLPAAVQQQKKGHKAAGNTSKADIKAKAAAKQAQQAENAAIQDAQAIQDAKSEEKVFKAVYMGLAKWAKAAMKAARDSAESAARDSAIVEAYRQAYIIQSLPAGLTTKSESAKGLIPFDESAVPELWKQQAADYVQYAWLVNLFADASDYAKKHDSDGNELWTSSEMTPEQAALLNKIADHLDMTKTSKGYQLTPAFINRLGDKQAEIMTGLIAAGYVAQPATKHYILTAKGLNLYGLTMADLVANYEAALAGFLPVSTTPAESPVIPPESPKKGKGKVKTTRKVAKAN